MKKIGWGCTAEGFFLVGVWKKSWLIEGFQFSASRGMEESPSRENPDLYTYSLFKQTTYITTVLTSPEIWHKMLFFPFSSNSPITSTLLLEIEILYFGKEVLFYKIILSVGSHQCQCWWGERHRKSLGKDKEQKK